MRDKQEEETRSNECVPAETPNQISPSNKLDNPRIKTRISTSKSPQPSLLLGTLISDGKKQQQEMTAVCFVRGFRVCKCIVCDKE